MLQDTAQAVAALRRLSFVFAASGDAAGDASAAPKVVLHGTREALVAAVALPSARFVRLPAAWQVRRRTLRLPVTVRA